MEKLIPVVNKLQDVFNAVGSDAVDLPQIVVIGSQSSGKSSVLENIVGRDFLPRGSGIVTRRPLVLQLINLPFEEKGSDGSFEEWGEFLHKPGETFYDFAKIRAEISHETDRVTGSNKGISALPINLKIYSPHVLNLTLVDLPGITRVPVGDQPTDIEEQIRKMNLTYISRPNAVIVAVSSANTDLANSDALALAREVDPNGQRTIGVITKLDIMDKGTNALDVLLGQVVPLKLGFVGVVSRSQADIIANKPIREALKSEQKFFSGHPIYRKIAHRSGTPYLAQVLNKLLLDHIRHTLPELKVKMSQMLEQAEKEMKSYGAMGDETNKGALLLSIITKFSSDFAASIEGKLSDTSAKELYGGARINYIFNEIFGKYLKSMGATDGLTLDDIRTALRNATGPRTALFVPEMSFELLTKRQITRLEVPSLQCVDAVYEELIRIVSQLESKELLRFAVLRERVVAVVTELLNECRSPSRTMIRNLVQIELAFVNTAHPDFVGAEGAINSIVERVTEEKVAMRKVDWMNQYEQRRKEEEDRERVKQATLAMSSRQGSASMHTGRPSSSTPATAMPPLPAYPTTNPFAASTQSIIHKPGPTKLKRSSEQISLDHVPLTIKAEGALSDREQIETDLIRSLLESYFTIIRKNIQDGVPKVIMHFLVNKSKVVIHNRLVEKLYKEDIFEELLSESPEIASRRKATKEMVEMLKRAREILNEVRDFALK